MDIRDIKGKPSYSSEAMQRMFSLQKTLLDYYTGIESLPKYPIDINTKSSQVLIKDFVSRIVEELGEAWESYEIMMSMRNKLLDKEAMIPHLQNFNEEVADSLHFWLELLIFSGITPNDLRYRLALEIGEDIKEEDDLLNGWLELGSYTLEFGLSKPLPAFWVQKEPSDEFLTGGRALGDGRYQVLKQLLWDITYHLQIARNTLKNKPWKQSSMMTDEALYKDELYKSTLAIFRFLSYAGFTKESIFHIYYKKNMVNQFRIKSKY